MLAVLVAVHCSIPLESIATDTIVPVSVSLHSSGYSQGWSAFGIDKTWFWSGGGGAGEARGFNVAVVNGTNLTVEETRNFDTWADRSSGGAHRALVDHLITIPNGRLVLVEVGDEAGLTQWGDSGWQKLSGAWVDAVIGTLQI